MSCHDIVIINDIIQNTNTKHEHNIRVNIPKLVMQTWKTIKLPEKWKSTKTSIEKYMIGWRHILMTDEMNREFIIKYFPDLLIYFDNFPYPIQRADAIRYAWLYINGGLYLDCDFELLGSLDELFTEDYDLFLLASSNTPDIITNGFIAAKPGNRLFLEMIEEIKKPAGLFAFEKHLHVMNTTGPLAFNRVIKRLNLSYKQLPSAKINPYTICDTEYNKPNTLMKPLEGSSWTDETVKIYHWCYCQSNYLLMIIIIICIITVFISIWVFDEIYIIKMF